MVERQERMDGVRMSVVRICVMELGCGEAMQVYIRGPVMRSCLMEEGGGLGVFLRCIGVPFLILAAEKNKLMGRLGNGRGKGKERKNPKTHSPQNKPAKHSTPSSYPPYSTSPAPP